MATGARPSLSPVAGAFFCQSGFCQIKARPLGGKRIRDLAASAGLLPVQPYANEMINRRNRLFWQS
jgi:hypothetical protein